MFILHTTNLKTPMLIIVRSLTLNQIGDEGARAFAEALGNNETLARLNLLQCKLTDEGVHFFDDVLQKNESLTHLK